MPTSSISSRRQIEGSPILTNPNRLLVSRYFMGGNPPERKAAGPWRPWCLLVLSSLVFASGGLAQTTSTSGTQGAVFHVLDQRTIYFGQHSVTLNLVAPPVVTGAVATPAPAPVVPPPKPTRVVADDELLFFLATVYDHQFTVLDWADGDNELTAVSNIDFTYLTTNDDFIAGNMFYEVMPVVGEESSANADPVTASWLARARSALVAGTPGYMVVSGTATPDEVQALNELHSYYGANSATLTQVYQQQQVAEVAQALQLKLHPPTRPDTVIYYWPIKSSVYLTGSSK